MRRAQWCVRWCECWRSPPRAGGQAQLTDTILDDDSSDEDSVDEHRDTANEESAPANRRKLQFGGTFGGALLTSGSFTMMAASGGF